jgi:hypothetical protein
VSYQHKRIRFVSLSATDNIEDVLLNNGVLDQFYALYPDVEVVIEASGGGRFGRDGGGASLTDVETKTQSADVALVNSYELSVQATVISYCIIEL